MHRIFVPTLAWSLFVSLILLYAFSLWALMTHRQDETFWLWSDALQILKLSLWQAGLSAFFSTTLGLLLARAFFYLSFKGKNLIYQTLSFIWVLPSLIIIFAVIGVWGNSGWLAQLFAFLNIKWQFSLYGLGGILIAHCLFNIPFALRYGISGLSAIPSSQHKLAAQLNLKGWQRFRIVEWQALKNILPYTFLTIFLVCFTSFPIVLMLGGGPKYSTLEVAIFQAVNFEFDFAKAVMLIGVQFVVAIFLQLLMNLVTHKMQPQTRTPDVNSWTPPLSKSEKRGLQAVIFILSFAMLLPLMSVIWSGVTVSRLFERLQNPMLWQATSYSVLLSLIASIVAVGITYLTALETRQLYYKKQFFRHAILAGSMIYPLILPIFLLSVGLFFLFRESELSNWQLLLLVGICNGVMLLPYLYQMIFVSLWQTLTNQDKLARSLGLTGFRRWWIVEKTYLIRPLVNAFSLAMSSSLGSFAVIAFFGSPDFNALPYLLYQQLGSYRMEDAAVTALVLMGLSVLPYLVLTKSGVK